MNKMTKLLILILALTMSCAMVMAHSGTITRYADTGNAGDFSTSGCTWLMGFNCVNDASTADYIYNSDAEESASFTIASLPVPAGHHLDSASVQIYATRIDFPHNQCIFYGSDSRLGSIVASSSWEWYEYDVTNGYDLWEMVDGNYVVRVTTNYASPGCKIAGIRVFGEYVNNVPTSVDVNYGPNIHISGEDFDQIGCSDYYDCLNDGYDDYVDDLDNVGGFLTVGYPVISQTIISGKERLSFNDAHLRSIVYNYVYYGFTPRTGHCNVNFDIDDLGITYDNVIFPNGHWSYNDYADFSVAQIYSLMAGNGELTISHGDVGCQVTSALVVATYDN
jgi:hypothetical protein